MRAAAAYPAPAQAGREEQPFLPHTEHVNPQQTPVNRSYGTLVILESEETPPGLQDLGRTHSFLRSSLGPIFLGQPYRGLLLDAGAGGWGPQNGPREFRCHTPRKARRKEPWSPLGVW